MAPQLDAVFETYLICNRTFLGPAVAEAIQLLSPPVGGRVLDAGTGGGGALGPLAASVGEQGVVVAADRDPAVLNAAARYLGDLDPALGSRVRFVEADLAAEGLSVAGGPFDLVWAADVIWAGNVGDPVAAVGRLVDHLAPGGTLALFYSNYYESTFLPGQPELARWARAASERRWKLRPAGPEHHDRHLAWLQANALDDVGMAVLPRSAARIRETDPAALAYLEGVVWPEILESVSSRGADVGMPAVEVDRLRHLLDPDDPDYVLDDPGYFVVHPTLLVTGRRPPADR